MKHERLKAHDSKKRIWYGIGIVLAILLICGLVFMGISVWNQYSQSIVSVQKEQMLNTVDSISMSLEHEINNYKDDVIRLCNMADYGTEKQDQKYLDYTFEQYLSTKADFVDAVSLKDSNGNLIAGTDDKAFTNTYAMSLLGDDVTLSERMDSGNELYFVFSKQSEQGLLIEIDVSVRSYYDDILSNIKIGTNGYLVVKTSNGIVIMHPEEEQWGMDVIKGREELYGVDELQSLSEMTADQLAGKTGVAEYDSYWWGNTNLPKVRKIAAYTPAYIGDDYLVVSAVMDYDDIYDPIFRGFIRIGAVFFCFFLLIIVFISIFTYMAFQKKKNLEEIEYLKDLNQVLEQTRQSEENITHQQRLQIMGTMTGGIAHEFNNMLTPIMGYADMLLDMLPADSDEYDYVREIFDASDRAKDVIVQIASLSRKNMETVYTFIPVGKLLRRTMKMVQSVCPVNVKITLDDKFSEEGFLGNETQMKQVILNLCVNAFHAIGKEKEGKLILSGSVERREEIEHRHYIVLAEEWDRYIGIRITDNGCGMSEETMEQIFTPFFTTKKTGKGTGLGLSVAEQIIHSHKGYIQVMSRIGEGTTFYLYLPCQENGNLSSRQMQEVEAISDNQKKILVVDDNEKILALLKKEFARIKIEVHTAEMPQEAKQKLKSNQYQILLIDRTLADNHSGINFAMSIQNQYPDMIKILMVDQVKKEVIEAIQQHTIDTYIEKPVSSASILEKVREIDAEKM